MAHAIAWPFFPCLWKMFFVEVLTEARRKLDSKTRFLDNKTIYHSKYKYTEVQNMKQCMDSANLHRRLKKIIGQVQAIDRMIDEDVPCEDVLSQMNAAKSAIHKCGQIVLEGHIKHCVKDGIEHGDADKTIEDFTKAVERFANMS